MSDPHTHIDEHVFSDRIVEDLGEYLPAVEKGIAFDLVIGVSGFPAGGRLTYGGGRDIHIQGFPTDRISSILGYLRSMSYLRSGAQRGPSSFGESDAFQDPPKIPLKVQRHTGKRGTGDSDEGHAG